MLTVTVRLSEVPLHLYQVLAGFDALRAAGLLRLRIERLRPGDPACLPYNMMEVVLPDGRRLIYDMNDGYRNLLGQDDDPAAFYDALLGRCDLLFKRSFSAAENARLYFYLLALICIFGLIVDFRVFVLQYLRIYNYSLYIKKLIQYMN